MACTKRSTKRRSFTHLDLIQRAQIQVLHNQGRSSREIGRRIGRTHQTVLNELKRGTTTQIGPNHKRFNAYFPETGQAVYEKNRRHCGQRPKLAQASAFIAYATVKGYGTASWVIFVKGIGTIYSRDIHLSFKYKVK